MWSHVTQRVLGRVAQFFMALLKRIFNALRRPFAPLERRYIEWQMDRLNQQIVRERLTRLGSYSVVHELRLSEVRGKQRKLKIRLTALQSPHTSRG